ncbi:hypothetical protein AAG906_035613 [Vitis piasezkii]
MKMEEKGKGRGLLRDECGSIILDNLGCHSRRLPSKPRIFAFWMGEAVNTVLGEGKCVDVFLWRNKKISAGVLGGAVQR